MISTYVKPVWLGYSQTGGAASLRIDELGGRLLIVGARSDEMASLFAYASREAGLRPLILDVDGCLSSRVSGYFPSYRAADVLYDLYRMDERRAEAHGELISSAYTAALDLTLEEEAILDAAMQRLAAQDNMASPPVVYDALSSVEGFRGFYVDKLKGRVGTLRALDAADSTTMAHLLSSPEGAIVDTSTIGMPRGSELGAALFIAKLVATVGAIPAGERPNFVMVNGIHRLFRALPKSLHGNRLFTALLESSLTCVFASDQSHALSSVVLEGFPTRILSADAWNLPERERRARLGPRYASSAARGDRPMPPVAPPVLPNSFVLQHGLYGSAVPFVARPLQAKRAVTPGKEAAPTAAAASPPPEGVTPPPPESEEAHADEEGLTRRVLQEIKAYDSPSMPSMVSYLSAEFPKEQVQKAIDDLERGGFVKLVPKAQKSGRTILSLSLTPKGAELLGRLA